MANVEIIGLEKLLDTIKRTVPKEMRPIILRDISRRPAARAAGVARQLMPIGDTGQTARTIGILKVKSEKATWVEVGFRGRSLGHIYMSGEVIKRQKRGSVKGFPWLFRRTGIASKAMRKDLEVQLTKVFVGAFRKRGLGV